MPTPDLLVALNAPQREAVVHGEGPLLILAGAGSGKTRVLTHRVAHLIGARGVAPEAILAITFTNKAAGELRERIGRLVGPRARAIWASTFHSACVRILRREAETVGYARDFTIYDADDQLRLLRRCFVEEDIDPKRLAHRAAQSRISDAKSRVLEPDDLAATAESFLDEQVVRIYRRYADLLRANGAMDFDDLLMLAVRLLEGDAPARERYQRRFAHVLVDEYQDTNHAQYRLVRVLGEPQRNVCVVGDDDQGIYSWRGADVRNIRDFTEDYPEAKVIALEQSYRCPETILRAANAVVANNPHRHPKELWTARPAGEPIQLVTCRDEEEEARVVAGEVERARQRGDALSQLAVFYRTNAQSRAIEDQLVRRGVAYQVIGGPKFYERAEVRDLLAWLRAAVNPADSVSLTRLCGAPRRGIGLGSVAKLVAFAEAHGLAVVDALGDAEMISGLRPAQRAGLAATGETLRAIAQADDAGMELPQLVELAIARSGLREGLLAEGTFEARGRVENLDELVNVAGTYVADSTDSTPGLSGFLEEIALHADADAVEDVGGRITLMTIHNAKGLEFDTVVITGLEEGLFPHARSDTPETLEEERRLFYVGITRARERLVLTHADTRRMHGGRDYRLPSRFLTELPPEVLVAPPGARRARYDERGAPRARRVAAPALSSGDSVLHATFGQGVVVAIEGGGDLVRVRFADDGTERRLMAGSAPMRKVS